MNKKSPIEESLESALRGLGLEFEQQFKVDNFICDFVFPAQMLIVECDGHEFHSTKEQRASDAKRDRKLLRRGWRVARYTGSEIYADRRLCALEIKEMLEACMNIQISVNRHLVEVLDRAGCEPELMMTKWGTVIVIGKPDYQKFFELQEVCQ